MWPLCPGWRSDPVFEMTKDHHIGILSAAGGRVSRIAVRASLTLATVFLVGCSGSGCERGRADGGRVDDVPACQSWAPTPSPDRDGVFRFGPRGAVTALGPRGAVTTYGRGRIEAADPCVTNVVVAADRVDVRADDLGGGVLRVQAGPVYVEVSRTPPDLGAEFSVTRDGPRVLVAVTKGHVVVTSSGDDREIRLAAGERWSRGGDG